MTVITLTKKYVDHPIGSATRFGNATRLAPRSAVSHSNSWPTITRCAAFISAAALLGMIFIGIRYTVLALELKRYNALFSTAASENETLRLNVLKLSQPDAIAAEARMLKLTVTDQTRYVTPAPPDLARR